MTKQKLKRGTAHVAHLGLLDVFFIGTLIAIFGGIVLHAPLSVGLGTLWPQYELLIKSWKEVLIGFALVLGVVILTRKKRWAVLKTLPVYLVGVFTVINVALIPVFYTGIASTVAGLFINLRALVFFLLVYTAVRLYPQCYKVFVRIFMAGAVLVVGFALLQVTVLPRDILSHIGYSEQTIMPYLTVDQNPSYIRINSTLRGPNPLGAYVVIVLGLVGAAWFRGPKQLKKYEIVVLASLALGGLVALWASYSRSAALGAVLAVGIVLFAVYGRRIRRGVWLSLGALVVIIGGSAIVFRDASFISQVVLHEDPNEGNSVNSNEGHANSLVDGTQRMLEQPFGGGVGSTGSASLLGDSPLIIENQYLFIAHETGWAGLLVYIYLHYVLLRELWRHRRHWLALGVFASGVGLVFVGLLLPVWTDDTVAIVWWGLAGVALAWSAGEWGDIKSRHYQGGTRRGN